MRATWCQCNRLFKCWHLQIGISLFQIEQLKEKKRKKKNGQWEKLNVLDNINVAVDIKM